MRKWLTPEREAQIIVLYEEYETAKRVADELGVSDQTVYRALGKHGIKRTHRHDAPKKKSERLSHCRSKYCPALVVMLREAFGYTARQIADATGCKYQAVRNMLTRRGYPADRKCVHAEDIDLDAIEREYLGGASTYELGERYGVPHETISKWMRKRGIRKGKGSNGGDGGRAYAAACKARLMERFAQVSDKVEYLSGNADSATVRCKACGRTFWWDNDRMWSMNVPCPRCRGTDNESRHVAKLQREYEHEQQLEAAREWRLSVPRICKECGEPFWSERETAAYCSDGCRKRANNRRDEERKKRNGRNACGYRHRMRIEKTPETYDPSVTLDALYKRKHGKCAMCGCKTVRSSRYSPRWATLDHIVALGNNGTHTWDNVQLLCSECNSNKRDLGQMRLAI